MLDGYAQNGQKMVVRFAKGGYLVRTFLFDRLL